MPMHVSSTEILRLHREFLPAVLAICDAQEWWVRRTTTMGIYEFYSVF